MRKLIMMLLAVIVFMPIVVMAKPKEKTYNATPEKVYEAALRVAKKQHNVTFLDDKHMILTFQTGMSMVSDGYNCNASVEPAGEGKATLIIAVQTRQEQKGVGGFGAGGRMANKFFKWVDEELAKPDVK